jgi:hypothetical protein
LLYEWRGAADQRRPRAERRLPGLRTGKSVPHQTRRSRRRGYRSRVAQSVEHWRPAGVGTYRPRRARRARRAAAG